jgi:SAM-dependent methyltransferase
MANSHSEYALGSTDAEHERLIRQAGYLNPLTERLFREAGIGPGQRILDIGSGVGDVAMLAARLVGSSGEVIGIERDSRSIARARTRVSEASLLNVSFMECDISQPPRGRLFDAAVGRFILQFVSDPAAVLRRISEVVRPGGVLAFQEVSYAPLLALSSHLPLWSASVAVARETVQRSGANPEMGVALHRNFQEAGLPLSTMRMEILLGKTADFTLWIYDLLRSLRPKTEEHQVPLEALGDFGTLSSRLQSEVALSNSVVPYVALVGTWSRKPVSEIV